MATKTSSAKTLNATLILEKGQAKELRTITIPADELTSQLNIDERYQRIDIQPWINELMAVLRAGGEVVEPICVAVRPDRSKWIFDGQQRFWAHVGVKKAIKARLFQVADIQAEKTLFHIHNNRRAVYSGTKVKGWPGSAGDLMLWLNENRESPLKDLVAFDSSGRYPATTLVRANLVALSGKDNSRVNDALARLSNLIDSDLRRARKTAQMLGLILRRVFEKDRTPTLPARALASVCYDRWHELKVSDPWQTPTDKEYGALSRIKWTHYAPDGKASWIRVLKEVINEKWPPARAAERKTA